MPRRAGTPEHLQASLQALPPDSPSSQTSEPLRRPPPVSGNAPSPWTVNSRDKPVLPRKPAKAVSLKLTSKGAAAGNPAPFLGACITGVSPLRRACSADTGSIDFSPEAQPRRLQPSHLAQKRSSSYRPSSVEEDRSMGTGGTSMVDLIGEKLSSTAPAVVHRGEAGRPPIPTRSLPSSAATASRRHTPEAAEGVAAAEEREEMEQVRDDGRVYGPVVAAPLRSLPRNGGRGSLGGRGAGFRGGRGGRGGRGALQPSTSGQQTEPTSSASSAGGLAALLKGVSARPKSAASRPASSAGALSRPGSSAGMAEAGDLPPSAPRMAWGDGGQSDDEAPNTAVSEMAAQIRRDLLVRALLDGGFDGPASSSVAEGCPPDAATASSDGGDAGGASSSASGGNPWLPRTEEARSALDSTDKTLAEAFIKAEARRRELGGFLEELRRRTFEDPVGDEDGGVDGRKGGVGDTAPAAKKKTELLVSLPVDFEDLCDINAQMSIQRREAAAQRRRTSAASAAKAEATARTSAAAARATAGSRSTASGSRDGGARAQADLKESDAEASATAKEQMRIPDFLQKYFSEEKALEQLPHKRLEKEEREEERIRLPDEETELQRNLRVISRLDNILLTREAAGVAQLQAGKVDLEAARESLAKAAQQTQADKIEVLQRIKERTLNGGASSVSSRRSTKSQCSTITPCGTPAYPPSGSCSSRSLATPDGGDLPSSRARITPSPDVLGDWSGWTCSAIVASDATPAEDSAPPTPVAATATHPTDEDTSTFDLTSGTGSFQNASQKQHPTSARRCPAGGLATVEEYETGAENDNPALQEAGNAVLDDPYAEDTEAIDALRSIDEQLQKLVPQQEWEAKSICSFSSHHGGSAAGDSNTNASRPPRSVWSMASRDSAAPGDPVLCDMFEKRESELALVSIDNRLHEVQWSETPLVPDSGQLKQLLLQASHESAAPDALTRVLALTGTAPLNFELDSSAADAALVESRALVPIAEPSAPYRESGVLSKARQILLRLENEEGEWTDAFGEAQNSMRGLEEDLQHLEAEQESRPATADRRPATGASEAESVPESERVSAFAARLDELRSQVASVLEQKGPDEDLMSRLRQQLEEGDEEVALPSLAGAPRGASIPEETEDEDLDVEGAADPAVSGGDLEAWMTSLDEVPAGDMDAWQNVRDGPNLELLKALDIELPANDGAWDDAQLAQMCGNVNSHYGDVPVEVPVKDFDSDVEDAEDAEDSEGP